MKYLLNLIILTSWFTGVQSAEELTQSDPAVIKPGNSHTLTCKGSGFTFSSYWMGWVRQFSDGRLQWLCDISGSGGSTRYHDDVKGRFTVTRDNNNNMLTLKMDNMKTEDSAMYYCAGYSGYEGYFDKWGQGTDVLVTSAQARAPDVYPLVPSYDFKSTAIKLPIGCLILGYFPEPAEVKWNSGLIAGHTFPGVRNPKGYYGSSSFVTVPVSDFKSTTYTCNVNHKPTNTKIDVKISDRREKPSPTPPNVKVTQASCGETSSVDLICMINGFYPDDIKIQWLLNGNPTSISPKTTPSSKDNEGHFESRSQVSVPTEDWNSGDTYTCKVSHPPSNTKKEDSIRKCSESSTFHPKVVLLPPSPKDLLITKEPKLTCTVSKLPTTNSLNFKWKRADGKRTQIFNSEPKQDYDGTYSVTSSLRVSTPDWESGKSFSCSVEHSNLPFPIEKTIQQRDEITTEPSIYLFPPPAAELANSDFVSVSCLIKGFSSKNIYVQWKKNGEVADESQYMNTEPILDEGTETYQMYSTLKTNKSDWNRESKYTCSSALGKITSAEIKKNSGK